MAPPRKHISRRTLLATGAVVVAAAGAMSWRRLRTSSYAAELDVPDDPPRTVSMTGHMPYRAFGATGLKVSETGFGSWALGGQAYGTVDRQQSLQALARAEECGCNFVDTAMVYGDSELVLGQFLRGRRDRWVVATKYSDQPAGMQATVEQQLRRLGTEAIDFYQLHWPSTDQHLYDGLYALKKAGKVRFVGVSLLTPHDIDYVIDHQMIDGVQLPFSLLDPEPFLSRAAQLRRSGLAVVVRSCLKEGFLTGKYARNATFPDPRDQRHDWSRAQIARTVDEVDSMRFLQTQTGSLLRAAVAYPLSFPQVSTVLLGTKSVAEAASNFGQLPGARLSNASIERVHAVQTRLDLAGLDTPKTRLKRVLGRY